MAESANVHGGETVRIEVRNSGATFYVTANGDEFLPFHTFGGTRDRVSCCRDTIQSIFQSRSKYRPLITFLRNKLRLIKY